MLFRVVIDYPFDIIATLSAWNSAFIRKDYFERTLRVYVNFRQMAALTFRSARSGNIAMSVFARFRAVSSDDAGVALALAHMCSITRLGHVQKPWYCGSSYAGHRKVTVALARSRVLVETFDPFEFYGTTQAPLADLCDRRFVLCQIGCRVWGTGQRWARVWGTEPPVEGFRLCLSLPIPGFKWETSDANDFKTRGSLGA